MKVILITLISVVIPVYNKAQYLDLCIESILNQTYKQLEIIIINDGSTDDSEEIIKKHTQKHTNIKYIYQDNQGVAETRNNGISMASGKYVLFVDADDILINNAIEVLVENSIKTNADIIAGNNIILKNNKKSKKPPLDERVLNPIDLKETDIKADMFLTNGRPLASACNKLYNSQFLRENNIKFYNGVFAEDRLFNLICYIHNPTISILNKFTYIYNVFEGSRSRSFSDTFFEEYISLLDFLYNNLKEKYLINEYIDLLQIIAVYDYVNVMNFHYKYSPNTINSIISTLKQMKNHKTLDKLLRSANEYRLFKKIKAKKLFLFKNRILLFLYVNIPSIITALCFFIIKKITEIKSSH